MVGELDIKSLIPAMPKSAVPYSIPERTYDLERRVADLEYVGWTLVGIIGLIVLLRLIGGGNHR